MGANISAVQPSDFANPSFNITLNCSTLADALNLLNQPVTDQTSKVLKINVNIEKDFNELDTISLKKLVEKFKNQSFVIFITATGSEGTRFYIYWKAKDSRKVLSLKSYKYCFSEPDKDLCQFVVNFLTNCLQDGHSGIQSSLEIWSTNHQIELHNLVDSRNYNLLLLASESGNAKLVEALLKDGIQSTINLEKEQVTAQSLAWQESHPDVLLKLCQANLPFPSTIDIHRCSKILKSFIETCQEFHKMIEEKNKNRLDEILKQNPNLRYFYDLSNNSALKAALELKSFDMYEFLISKNLQFGPNEDPNEIWKNFEATEKRKLREIHLKYSKNIEEKHIYVLMSNTFLSHYDPDEDAKRKLILRAYRALNADPRLKIILRIVAATKIFKIVFDFHRDSTDRIDPTTNSGTGGICYFTGRIIVGAKKLLNPETENEAFGVLVHELCHYAMVAVYQNEARPYTTSNQQAKEEFDRIIEGCKENAEDEEIIDLVYKCYEEASFPVELIVRPAQLIALYCKVPEFLAEVIESFNELFNYYINVVIPAMEQALPEIEGRLVYKPTYNYAKLSDQDKQKVQNAIVKYKDVEIIFVELFPENFDIFDLLTSDHISLMLASKVLNFDDAQFRYLEEQIDLKWESLAKKLKEKLLSLNLNFQGEIVKFYDLFESYYDVFYTLTSQQIIQVLSDVEIIVGIKLETMPENYSERKFILENVKNIMSEYLSKRNENVETNSLVEFSEWNLQNYNTKLHTIFDNPFHKKLFLDKFPITFRFMQKSIDDVISQVDVDKAFILSEDEICKTTTLKQIALKFKSKFPLRWISFVDIKHFTKFYMRRGAPEDVKELLKNIFDLSLNRNKFEVQIFEKSFDSGNLVIIWDGFNDISTEYHEFFLNTLTLIRENSENIQFISTKTLYSDKLRTALRSEPWKLAAIDLNDISIAN